MEVDLAAASITSDPAAFETGSLMRAGVMRVVTTA
jgi:hypothetical protein